MLAEAGNAIAKGLSIALVMGAFAFGAWMLRWKWPGALYGKIPQPFRRRLNMTLLITVVVACVSTMGWFVSLYVKARDNFSL